MTAVTSCPGQPWLGDAETGGPVFAEPWQAQAFAMAIQLHERGLFTWPEWAAALSAQIAAAQASQNAQRARLQDYIARNSARASTAKQAQSRAKMLAKMQPIAAMADDPSLSFDFPSPTELKPPLITLDMAAVGYTEGNPILRKLNLRIDPDDRIALLGRNGNGKTTLARTVLRLYEPQQGRIVFAGNDIAHAHEATLRPLRERMQMIFQDPLSALNPRRRVGEIVVQPLLAYGRLGRTPSRHMRDDRARQLLEQVALPAAFAERWPHELSGGQRQRVGIARAIALEPALIVADEIVSGLDVSTQARILVLLRELRQRLGTSMIFVTHDLSVVRVLCDRVAVMHEGRIVEQGPTAEVFAAPRHAYTRALLEAIPRPEIGTGWLEREAATSP